MIRKSLDQSMKERPVRSAPLPRSVPIWLQAPICAATVCAASPVMAQSGFGDQKERIVAAIKAAGCIVHAADQVAILVDAGLCLDQGSGIANRMMDVGEAEPFADDLRLETVGGPWALYAGVIGTEIPATVQDWPWELQRTAQQRVDDYATDSF